MKAYFTSAPSRSTPSLSQDIALHLHPRQLSPQPGNLHLLGAHRFAVGTLELTLTARLDPVEQRLFD
jgi:hypothetical protein